MRFARAEDPAAASEVWQRICAPCSILEWNPRIAECHSYTNAAGQVMRDYVLAPGGDGAPTMVETELSRLDAIMTITYTVDINGLPISDYVAQISVTPAGDADCEVELRSRFVDLGVPGVDASDLVAMFYEAGLQGLSDLMDPTDDAAEGTAPR
ncbi:MAG: SRPBCC family protein [Pseudomonadota bacterium]